jgi:hypothetical protein
MSTSGRVDVKRKRSAICHKDPPVNESGGANYNGEHLACVTFGAKGEKRLVMNAPDCLGREFGGNKKGDGGYT